MAKQKNKIIYRMLQILPEIYSSGIYKKYCRTIQGYALQFGGIPESVVLKRLKLEKDLINKPELKNIIQEVGVHKVALVAKIATADNEAVLAEKLKTMSTIAVQELSKELRQKNMQQPKVLNLELSDKLIKLWNTAKKQMGAELSDQEFLEELLVGVLGGADKCEEVSAQKNVSRHIPKKLREKTFVKFHNKCAYPYCVRDATEIHHTERYSLVKNHNKLVPLCKIHHQFAHYGLIENEADPPHLWNTSLQSTSIPVDLKYQSLRL